MRARSRVVALLPLALLSGSWTVALVGAGPGVPATPELPPSATVPVEALEVPASHTVPGRVSLGVPHHSRGRVVRSSSTHGIPSEALAAYQRAETVINAADKACNLDWQLIAAIGRVESDHGRYGGNVLGADGVSRPGIYGIALDGSNGTQAISDTDAGQYDRDKVWDRAVGPMQFIPSTWSIVGVDADGDGRRNPQSIHDAALAAAAYLCAGPDDLATDAGRRAAALRYNHSWAYVDLVLRVREAYLQGHDTAVPGRAVSAAVLSAASSPPRVRPRRDGGAGVRASESRAPASGSTAAPPADAVPSEPAKEPEVTAPSPGPARQLAKTITRTVETTDTGVKQVLSLAQATLACAASGHNALLAPKAWNDCIHQHTT